MPISQQSQQALILSFLLILKQVGQLSSLGKPTSDAEQSFLWEGEDLSLLQSGGARGTGWRSMKCWGSLSCYDFKQPLKLLQFTLEPFLEQGWNFADRNTEVSCVGRSKWNNSSMQNANPTSKKVQVFWLRA